MKQEDEDERLFQSFVNSRHPAIRDDLKKFFSRSSARKNLIKKLKSRFK